MELKSDVVIVQVVADGEGGRESGFAGGVDKRDKTFLIDRGYSFTEVPRALVLRRNDDLTGFDIQVSTEAVKRAEDNEAVFGAVGVDEDVFQVRCGIFTSTDVFELLKAFHTFVAVFQHDVLRYVVSPAFPITDFVVLVVIDFTHEACKNETCDCNHA